MNVNFQMNKNTEIRTRACGGIYQRVHSGLENDGSRPSLNCPTKQFTPYFHTERVGNVI